MHKRRRFALLALCVPLVALLSFFAGTKVLSTHAAGINPTTCSSLTGYYKLVNRNSGENLDVSGASTKSGALIVQNPDNGQSSQQWSFVDAGNGSCKIVNRRSGLLLNNPGGLETFPGTQLIQYLDNGNVYSQWSITSVGGGYYDIVSPNDGQNVDVQYASTANGAPVIEWANNGGTNQQWQLVPVS